MIRRRNVLAAGLALPLWGEAALRPSVPECASLKAAAASSGRRYGTAAASYQLKIPEYAALLGREAALLVPEYELKRDAVEPRPGSYDFSGAEALLAFARRNGMALRGHTLVWYTSNPPWLDDAVHERRDERLFTNYIARVMGHFGSAIASWDVVNEAIKPSQGRADGLRRSLWLEVFGPSYIDTAFHAARAAQPTAELVYNDWGCEQAGPEHDKYRAATLTFLEAAKARGVPIDALGLQGHLSAFGAGIDQRALAVFLERVRALGCRILITELDVDDRGGTLDRDRRDQAVADMAARFLDVVLDNPACQTVLTWGLSDRFLAVPSLRARLEGYAPRFLPFDADFAPKPLAARLTRSFLRGAASPC